MNFSREETALVLSQLGYEIDRAYKFKLRPDEKTPSASIHPRTGKIKDFGSGWYGSPIDLMVDIHGYTKPQAFDFAQDILGREDLKLNLTGAKKEKTEAKEKSGFITQNIIDKFIQERKENFTRFWELLSQTLPTATAEIKKEIALKFEIGYTKMGDRLIMPIRDENGNCKTLWKYNKNPTPFIADDGNIIQMPKYKFTGDRERCMFNIKGLKEYIQNPKEPIFIMEGEKDCLNAIASGLRAISIGSSTSPINEKHLNLFKDTNITICYDNDEAGKNGSKAVYNQLKDICKKVEIIDWEQMTKQLNLKEPLKKGFDFTDYLTTIESINKSRDVKKEQEI